MATMAHVCNPKCRPSLVQRELGGSAKVEQEAPKTMSTWLERQASSHQIQLAAVALASGAVVAGAIYGSQAIRREKKVSKLKASIPELSENHHAEEVYSGIFLAVLTC